MNTTVEEYITNFPDQLYDVVLCLEVLETYQIKGHLSKIY